MVDLRSFRLVHTIVRTGRVFRPYDESPKSDFHSIRLSMHLRVRLGG